MVGLLAGLSVSIEAQSLLDKAMLLNTPDVFAGIKKTAGLTVPVVSDKETARKAPRIVIGDISLHDGIRARSITLYGSSDPYDFSDPLPGLDQALAGCDGNQAKGWVSYSAVTITCLQGGVEISQTIDLPPSTYKVSSLAKQSKSIESKMLIAKNRETARLVVDGPMLTATTKILSNIQYGSPFANNSYAIDGVRHAKNDYGKDELIVDLRLVDEGDLSQPPTDGIGSSKKCIFPGKCGSGRKSSDSGGDENQEEGEGSQSLGGNGGDGRDPGKNNGTNKPKMVNILSIAVNLEQLIEALQELVKYATNEQSIMLSDLTLDLIMLVYKSDDIKKTADPDQGEQEGLPDLMADMFQRSGTVLQNEQGDSAITARNVLTEILSRLGSGEPINNVMQALRDQGYLDKLRTASSESASHQVIEGNEAPASHQEDEGNEAPAGAVANSAENSAETSNSVARLINRMMLTFMEINFPENSETAPDDQATPEYQANSEEPPVEAPDGSQANTGAEAPAAGSEAKKESETHAAGGEAKKESETPATGGEASNKAEAPEGSQANNGIQTSNIDALEQAELLMFKLQHPKFCNALRLIVEAYEESQARRKTEKTTDETTGDNTAPEGKKGDLAKRGQNQKIIWGAIT
ncbi:hypothetical protein NX722_14635 [Endozoicomonas gorgoniicola]|uniref:Uncharacterized protein n=1 Tax=Endozoicomonas gorgoniicola TaxID=1234144 RepID=A0ABT3MWT3_9GAMM|nr:hypothetical protein [Endozoicomonas gorgoniicola]MCW7553839.1 hypothetical protein [Endozoicomonas gorgoniicola]